MTKVFKLLFIGSLISLLSACASNHMTQVPVEEQTTGPEAGKALIHFMRPTSFGGAIQSTLHNGDEYIGTISANTRMCYQADPGNHMFMIVGESADFLRAQLLPDKTYYINVAPRMGVWTARFSLRPMNGQVPQQQIDEWVNRTQEVVVNEKGERWAEKNQQRVQELKNKYLPRWQQKAERDKQTLHPESGK